MWQLERSDNSGIRKQMIKKKNKKRDPYISPFFSSFPWRSGRAWVSLWETKQLKG